MASKTLAAEKDESLLWDIYQGTLDQIVAAGVAHPSEFPGAPGHRPFARRYFTAAGVEIGKPHDPRTEAPGSRHIMRDSKNHYRLYVCLPETVKERRLVAHRAEMRRQQNSGAQVQTNYDPISLEELLFVNRNRVFVDQQVDRNRHLGAQAAETLISKAIDNFVRFTYRTPGASENERLLGLCVAKSMRERARQQLACS